MSTAKKAVLMLVQMALLYIAVAIITVYAPNVFLLRNTSTIVLMICSLALLLFFSDHIIDADTRKYLIGIAGLITLWTVLRGAKYFAFEETEIIARHIWYLYYLPALLIPLLSLFASLSVGGQVRKKSKRKRFIAVVITICLILAILSNDVHQLVFRFQPGFADWDADYSRGPVFFAVYGWIALLFVGTIWILFIRCRVSSSRRLIWVPVIPAVSCIIYLILNAVGVWPRLSGMPVGQFPETVCFSIAGVWLGLIRIGLIPANTSYSKIFVISSLGAQIADRDFRIIYRSMNAAPLSLQQMTSGDTLFLGRNTRLHRKPVQGGFVYWQDDVQELNRINEELWELGEQLAEEAELVRLENELKEKRVQIEAKSRVYDRIAAEVAQPSNRIAALCADAEKHPERYAGNMKLVCLLAAYVKRYANLSLLAADQPLLEEKELQLAIAESLRYVADLGIPAESSFTGTDLYPAQRLLHVYALFQSLLEQALPRLQGIQVSIRDREMRMTLEGAAITLQDSSEASLLFEDDVSYVRIPFGEAGACV